MGHIGSQIYICKSGAPFLKIFWKSGGGGGGGGGGGDGGKK